MAGGLFDLARDGRSRRGSSSRTRALEVDHHSQHLGEGGGVGGEGGGGTGEELRLWRLLLCGGPAYLGMDNHNLLLKEKEQLEEGKGRLHSKEGEELLLKEEKELLLK